MSKNIKVIKKSDNNFAVQFGKEVIGSIYYEGFKTKAEARAFKEGYLICLENIKDGIKNTLNKF